MFAKLSALVGSSQSLPFQVEEDYGRGWGHWAHARGRLNADGSPVSVFKMTGQSETDAKLIAARNGVKRLKMVCWLVNTDGVVLWGFWYYGDFCCHCCLYLFLLLISWLLAYVYTILLL